MLLRLRLFTALMILLILLFVLVLKQTMLVVALVSMALMVKSVSLLRTSRVRQTFLLSSIMKLLVTTALLRSSVMNWMEFFVSSMTTVLVILKIKLMTGLLRTLTNIRVMLSE